MSHELPYSTGTRHRPLTLSSSQGPFPLNSSRQDFHLLDTIRWVLAQPPKEIHDPPFRFDLSDEATDHNFNTLKNNNFSLESVLASSEFSPCHFGSEFRDTSILEKLFTHHPYWPRMKRILENGTPYVYKNGDLPEETCRQDLIAALERGNHKSALKKEDVLESAMKKEVKFRYQLLMKPSHILKIPGARLSPMGVADQLTISELGEVIQKDRVTQDLSFPGKASGESINLMIDDSSLFDLIYGHMHSRCIHQIVATRKRFPSARILGNKADFKSAYRRPRSPKQSSIIQSSSSWPSASRLEAESAHSTGALSPNR